MNRFPLLLKFLTSLSGCLSPALQAELEQLITFIKTEGKVTIIRKLKKLKVQATSIITEAYSLEKEKFFIMGENGITKMWMSNEFISRVKNFLPATISAVKNAFDSFDLTENMYDSQIMPELGNPLLPKMSVLIASVASMVAKQSKGETGLLLTNGYANIFYGVSDEDGRTLVLYVSRYDGKWRWYCSELDERGRWLAGLRVFSSVID